MIFDAFSGETLSLNGYLFNGGTVIASRVYLNGGTAMYVSGFESYALEGTSASDTLAAADGNDYLSGGDGDDLLLGRGGADQMVGGVGSDRFVFVANTDSSASTGVDHITDFTAFDVLDFSAMSAVDGAGSASAFAYIGSAAFSAAGQLRAYVDGSGNTVVEANTGGSLAADFQLVLDRYTGGLTGLNI